MGGDKMDVNFILYVRHIEKVEINRESGGTLSPAGESEAILIGKI
jgi:hypothetical protein